jgi:F-type H+-transporting ATPase subunit b
MRVYLLPLLVITLVICSIPQGGTEPTHAEAPPGHPVAGASTAGHTVGEKGGAPHEPGLFDIDPAILIGQIFNFGILFFLLQRFLFVPVQAMLEERQKKIAQDLEAARAANQQAQERQHQFEAKLATVEEEGYRIRQKSISDAQAAEAEILAKAKKHAEDLVTKAKREIALDKQKAWVHLREEVVRLTMIAAGRVVEKSLDDATHRRLIHSTIEQLESNFAEKPQE